MSVFIYEKVGSRETNLKTESRTISLEFLAGYTYDELEVQTALIAYSPVVFDGMSRNATSAKHIGAGLWECTVDYDISPTSIDVDTSTPDYSILDKESTFEISPLTGHLSTGFYTSYKWKGRSPTGVAGDTIASGDDSTVASATVANLVGISAFSAGDKIVFEGAFKEYTIVSTAGSNVTISGGTLGAVGRNLGVWAVYAAATGRGTAPSYRGAIGVTRDSVAGVDIPSPSADYTYTHQVTGFSWDDYRVLESLRSTTNFSTWRGWQPGEVMYLGTSGSWSTNSFWKLTHRFAVRRNKYAVRVSEDIVIPFVGGWEYLWTTYRDDTAPGAFLQIPTNTYVERVLRRGNFLDIGIGV